MNQLSSFQLLEDCAALLEDAVASFNSNLPLPQRTPEPSGRFEYQHPDDRIYVFLRCVRIVSGLNASLALVRLGYTQEVGVLLRTVLEFCHDIDFIVESYRNEADAPKVAETVSTFFSEQYVSTEELLQQTKKSPTVPRKKIYAAIGRMLGNENPHRIRQIAKVLEDLYSGYVHGNYHHVLELYSDLDKRFELNGQPYRIYDWLRYLSLIMHQVLNQFSTVASAFGLEELEATLINKRKDLELSPLYSGY